jgi:DHA2 family multidrug resistance protein
VVCLVLFGLWFFGDFIQGIGGGALFATSQTILKEIYPPEKIGMAMAMFGMGVIVGPTIGPYSRWLFSVPIILGLLSFLLIFQLV